MIQFVNFTFTETILPLKVVNELLQPDSVHEGSPTPSLSAAVPLRIQHDAETQVHIVPERKNARVQTQVRTKATGNICVLWIW